MTPDDQNASDALRQRAVHWFTRMQSGDATQAERAACNAWRQQDPSHERMYRSIDFLWDASRQLPQDAVRAILNTPDTPQRTSRVTRRQFGLGLLGACSLAGVAAVTVLPAWRRGAEQYRTTLATRPSQRGQTTLPDGSTLSLNVNTRLEVALYAGQRHIALLAGEAFFDVAHDPQRPFIVQAGHATVEVTGTRFQVRRDPDRVSVGVESGSVNVTSGAWWRQEHRQLRAGQGVAVQHHAPVGDVVAVRIENVAAWRDGKIVFDNTPLETVVAEMNRYLPQAAALDAPQLRDYRIAGVFNIDEPQAMMEALPAIAPVRLQRLTDGRIRVLAR